MRKAPADDEFDFEGEPEPDSALLDKHGLAAMTGFTLKQIEGFAREGMPTQGRAGRGAKLKFSVPECVQWIVARSDDPMAAAKRRQAEAIARKREAEAGKLEDAFVEIATVEQAIRNGVAKFQSELASIPARCPPEARELVRAEINGAINRLAGELRP